MLMRHLYHQGVVPVLISREHCGQTPLLGSSAKVVPAEFVTDAQEAKKLTDIVHPRLFTRLWLCVKVRQHCL